MNVGGYLLSLGIGMAAGATIMLMMPKQNTVRKAAQKAADTMEGIVCGRDCCGMD